MTFINTALLRATVTVAGLRASLRARVAEERGQDLIEYAMLGGLIAVAIIGAGFFFQGALALLATGIGNCIDFVGLTDCDPF